MPGVNSSRAWMLRLAGLLGIGALSVHQLRYLLAYGGSSPPRHGYLGPVGSLVAGVTVVALAELIARAARGGGAPAPRLRSLWAGTTSALIGVFAVQELAEGASVTGRGGWLAVPLAAVVALAIALLMCGASAATLAARRPWRPPAPLTPRALAPAAPALPAHGATPRLLLARGPPPASA
jgi:hypothetical protein